MFHHNDHGGDINELLQKAVDAHGGLKSWREISKITVTASLSGAIWFVKSQVDDLKSLVMEIDTSKQRLATDFPVQDKRSISKTESPGNGEARWNFPSKV